MSDSKRILVIGLSNIGDCVLMSPVIARLHGAFPGSQITLAVSERAQCVFEKDPRIQKIVATDEFSGVIGKIKLIFLVWNIRPHLLIDLRYAALALCYKPWRAWRYFIPVPKAARHARDRHLFLFSKQAGIRLGAETPEKSLWISDEAKEYVSGLMKRWGIDESKRLVVACPGARSPIKRWQGEKFAAVCDGLIERHNCEVLLTGEVGESEIINEVLGAMKSRAHSAVGSTTVLQAGALMERASLVITNDSASLHIACAVGAKVLAIFGPTDHLKYGPTGKDDLVIRRRLFCTPCEKANCRYSHECMRFIPAEEVFAAAEKLLKGKG